MHKNPARRATLVLLMSTGLVACGAQAKSPTAAPSHSASETGSVREAPPAADFVRSIDNQWMPLQVGTRWRYIGRTDEGVERTVVTVTDRTRMVAGVSTTVIRDIVHLNGKLLEDTRDWFAQDSAGNVWYFGEDTKEYDGDKVDTSGSWEAGVDGAKPGIAMLAKPSPGDAYRQEFYQGEAEDEAKVLGTDATAKVPYGDLDGLVKTLDFTRLEPTADEHKFYAKGVGMVLSVSLQVKDRAELISMTTK